jgi:serine/threonine protein phosphatase PrpC
MRLVVLPGATRAWLATVVIVTALLELYFPLANWLARLAVDALALLGAIMGGLVLWGARGEDRKRPETVVREQVRPPRPYPARPPSSGQRSVVRSPAEVDGWRGLIPPRFGKGSKAQALPWLLSAHTVYSGIAADEGQLGDLVVRAASVVGPGHRCEEPLVPRQDAYRLGRDENRRYLIVAVADGVSSSRFAELGATVAVSAAINLLRDRLGESPDLAALAAPQVFSGVAVQMADTAAARNLRNSDVCAALVTAVIPVGPTDGEGEREMWVAWVGDASVWTLQDDAWTFVAGDGKRASGGVESNALAHALPDSPLNVISRSIRLEPGAVVALVTDGVGDALATIGEANRYFARNWARPPSSTSFVNDVSYDAERFIDDRTAVAIWVGADSEGARRPRR